VITEGEIDMMSVSQVFDNKWPTGSLPNGTGSVEKAIKKDYEKLCRFENIVLCFDNDEPGQKALQKACELLPVGKVKIMTLPAQGRQRNAARQAVWRGRHRACVLGRQGLEA
jgi:twinkle protein